MSTRVGSLPTETVQVLFHERPTGTATADCFIVESAPLAPLEAGEVRVAVEHLSVDAGTRTMLRGEGFHQQIELGQVVSTSGVGRVVESASDTFAVGDAVRGRLGAQTVATVPASALTAIDESLGPLRAHLGLLGGSTGITAWIGIRCVAKPQPGDVFVVSAAAGAVGSIAGQIARLDGARVIGIAGGADKCAMLTETLGFDAAIDYRNEDVTQRLRELAPDGVNGFFDNVGGDILDSVLDHLAMRARVTICGAVSQYDDMDNVTGPSLYLRLAERQSSMEGFAFFHFPEQFSTARAELAGWLADGSVVMREHILDGIESYPDALRFMFEGGNTGKLLVAIASPDSAVEKPSKPS